MQLSADYKLPHTYKHKWSYKLWSTHGIYDKFEIVIEIRFKCDNISNTIISLAHKFSP